MIARLRSFFTTLGGLDPMTRKELFGVSRRWQTYAGRTLYVGILAVVLAIAWNEFSGRGMVSYSRVARFGRELFYAFAVAQMLMIALAAVGGAADMVSKEVRSGTLGLLKITPLSAWAITWGKWKAVMANVVMLMLAGIPVLGVGIYLGGASALELLGVFVMTLSTGVLCAAVGLLFSSLCRSAARPLVISVLALAAYTILPVMVAEMAYSYSGRRSFLEGLSYVHPGYTLIMMVDGGTRGTTLFAAGTPWFTSSVVAGVQALVLLVLAAWRISALRAREHRAPLLRRFFEALDRLFERGPFGRKLWRARTEVWDSNPYLWKEMHFRVTGRLRWYIRIVVVAMLVVTVLTILVMDDLAWSRDLPVVTYCVVMILFFLSCVNAGGSAFTHEKEEQKWGILMTTPMRPGQIMVAKLGGALTGTLTHVFILGFLLACASFVREIPLIHLGPIFAFTLIFGFYIIAAGLFASLALSTTRKAYMTTLFAALFFIVIFPVGVSLLMLVNGRGGNDVIEFVWDINPFRQLEVLTWGSRSYWSSRNYEKFWVFLFQGGFIYGGIGLGLLAATKVNFDALARRNL